MKILFTPYCGGSIAHIVRSFPIARALVEAGHEVLFTSSVKKEHFIKSHGFLVYNKPHPDVNLNDDKDQSINYFITNHRLFIEWFQNEIDAAKEFKPHVIVNSPSFFGAITARALNIPHVSITNAQWLVYYKGLLGLGKTTNIFSHRLLRRLLRPVFVKKFETVYLAEIQKVYQKLKIKIIPQRREHLHADYPVIIPSIPEFEPIETITRKDIHYVGPLFWDGFEEEGFKESDLFGDTRKPFIYITLGGSIFSKDIYIKFINAFNDQRDWNTLFTIGPNFKRDEFMPDNEHLVIKQYGPGLKINEVTDVMVGTGGHGTVMQALWHSSPMVCIPFNIDQSTISARIAELGLGINLNPLSLRKFTQREEYVKKAQNISATQIVEAVKKILNDPSYKYRTDKFREIIRRYHFGAEKSMNIILEEAKKSSFL